MDVCGGDYLQAEDAWEELVWVWKQTDAPKGCKVEIINGFVTVAPYSAVAHHKLSEPLQRRIDGVIPKSWGVYQRLPLAVPSRLELYVPDLCVVPGKALLGGDEYFDPAGVAELVVEITSAATAQNDRTAKAAGCAEAGVPLYLLVDRLAPEAPTVTLYRDAKGGAHRVLESVEFGAPVGLPGSFHLTLPVG